MTAISPTATGPRPIAPPLAEMQSSRCMARGSICCWAGAPTISGRASGRRRRAALCLTGSTPRRNTSQPTGRTLSRGFEGLGPDLVDDILRIKASGGPDLILSGSSTLTSVLLEHGLADEVLLFVYPVLLGKGKRFFSEGTPPRSFELASTKALPSGIVINAYNAAGPLKNQP